MHTSCDHFPFQHREVKCGRGLLKSTVRDLITGSDSSRCLHKQTPNLNVPQGKKDFKKLRRRKIYQRLNIECIEHPKHLDSFIDIIHPSNPLRFFAVDSDIPQ
jgi:hypothetical protein